MKHYWRAFLAVLVILLSSCVSVTYEWIPKKIAIMPFTNESADVAVESFARVYLYDRIERMKRHELIPLSQVDAALNDLGITEGGQLPTVTVEELCAATGADGIIFGNILAAKRVMLGVFFNKEFECNYQLVRGSDEAVFWNETEKESEMKFILDPKEAASTAAAVMVTEIARDALLKAFKSHPLYQQIEIVTSRAVRTLPR